MSAALKFIPNFIAGTLSLTAAGSILAQIFIFEHTVWFLWTLFLTVMLFRLSLFVIGQHRTKKKTHCTKAEVVV
jgi:ABC-type transport system involved in Fe-S cluster assembly fused permease/ATPase subunit